MSAIPVLLLPHRRRAVSVFGDEDHGRGCERRPGHLREVNAAPTARLPRLRVSSGRHRHRSGRRRLTLSRRCRWRLMAVTLRATGGGRTVPRGPPEVGMEQVTHGQQPGHHGRGDTPYGRAGNRGPESWADRAPCPTRAGALTSWTTPSG